ncbi:unnamed protein product [Cylindrotheca closterium]|uniref:Uncharacterized protein n=1 Tax=Cylindrotheca closterium TaxID=2856 RepID=A0AAD2CRM5_9STRA|nr:unnamed protein product [Cylindrotheca closterium]
MCCHCDISTNDIINPDAFKKVNLYSPEDFDTNQHPPGDEEYWKSVSHHPIVNALDEMCHGSNSHKTHIDCPAELLHMLQKGGQMWAVESFEYQFRNGTKITLDDKSFASKKKGIKKGLENLNFIGHQMGAFLSRQSDRNKPRTKFKNSLFSSAKKCGHEHAGVILSILLTLMTDRGRQICLEERTMEEDFLDNFVYLFEIVLVMEQWLKSPSFPADEVLDGTRLSKALGVYVENIGAICQRKGMGARLIKNHLMLHLPHYIMRWGPPSGWDGSNLERSHKRQAKRPAQLTQRRQDCFIAQLSARYTEMRLMQYATQFFGLCKSLWATNTGRGRQSTKPMACTGSRFTVGLDTTNSRPGVKWTKDPGRQVHIQTVIDTAFDHIVSNLPLNNSKSARTVDGFTEYKKEIRGESVIFRAHPSFRSKSRQQRDVWYDWALFDLEDQGYGSCFIPGQVLMFLHVPHLQREVTVNGMRVRPNKPHAIVRLFKEKPRSDFREVKTHSETGEENEYSLLVEFGDTQDELSIIPCDYIAEPTIVVQNIPMLQPQMPLNPKQRRAREKMDGIIKPLGEGYFVVSPRSTWSSCFSHLIQSYPSTLGFNSPL